MLTQSTQAGERTQSVAEFSEEQFTRRRKDYIQSTLQILASELETEEDTRNRLADRMAQNQKLQTSEERLNDGFSIIYGDLRQSEYRVEKLREAISALKTII